MQTVIRGASTNLTNAGIFTVSGPNITSTVPVSGTIQTGFNLQTNNTDTIVFVNPGTGALGLSAAQQLAAWKFFRLIGTTQYSFIGTPGAIPSPVLSTYTPNFLPTDYIDIVSKTLTNYKEVKDTNASETAPQGVIARVYLTDSFRSIITQTGYADPNCIGAAPFTFVKKWTSPNWCQWSPNQAITSIDIKLLDMWGTELYWQNATGCAQTEWEMTIVASE